MGESRVYVLQSLRVLVVNSLVVVSLLLSSVPGVGHAGSPAAVVAGPEPASVGVGGVHSTSTRASGADEMADFESPASPEPPLPVFPARQEPAPIRVALERSVEPFFALPGEVVTYRW